MTTQPHRRVSSCYRHPAATPVTGFCPSCLRERLAGIQSQSPTSEASTSTAAAQLRRSKSCSRGHNPFSSSASEPRLKSCYVRAQNTLHDLFAIDDRIKNPNLNPNPDPPPPSNVQDITVLQDLEEEVEFKTMKEFIDLEWSGKKSSRNSLWDAASVFSKKLRKWRRKQEKKMKEKNASLGQAERPNVRSVRESQSEVGEYGLGRRSCDTDPRLSVDIMRLCVDDSRFSFEEHRASWDGYLIGKHNPRLTQMVLSKEGVNADGGEEGLSVVNEAEKRSGRSAQTRDYYADSVSSHRRRSFDCAGLNRRMGLGEADDLKSSISNAKVSPDTTGLFHGAKLLVTEKELRDSNWYSLKDYGRRSVDSASKDVDVGFVASGVSEKGYDLRKLPKWKNLLNIWGLMQRRKDSLFEDVVCMEGDVGNGSLVESLQKLRMTSRAANGNKDECVEGNLGNENLIGSLQKLRRVSNAEEDRDSEGKVGDETLAESLQKLRRVSDANEDRDIERKVCDGTLAESLQKLRRMANGDATRGAAGQKLMRSCSVSYRNSSNVERASDGTNSGETRDDSEKRRDKFLLQQNRNVRYSPNNLDNGLLRLYLTPLRSYRRSKSGKSRPKSMQSADVNVL